MDPFYLALLLYCAAVVLAFVDLFIPSGGLLLILATAAALGSILFGFRSGTTMGMTMLTIVSASVPAFAYAAIKIWPKTPIGKRIILGLPKSEESATDRKHPWSDFLGKVLIAESPLMPSGQIRIGHRRYNAVAENGLIEAGQHVEIVAVKERNLVVRVTSAAVTPAEPATSEDQVPEGLAGNLLDLPADQLGIDSLDQ